MRLEPKHQVFGLQVKKDQISNPKKKYFFTFSFFSFFRFKTVNSQIWKYANPHFYQQEGCLKPSTQIKDLRIWSEAYAGDLSTSQAESRRTVDAMIRANSENVSRLQQKAIKLMQQVKEQNKH